MTTVRKCHLPSLGGSPTNPRMVTHQKEVYYRLGNWHLHITHDTNTRRQLPSMVTYHYLDGHPPTNIKLVGKSGSRFVSLGGTVNSQVLFVKSFGQPRVLAIFSLFSSIPPGVMISQVLFVKRFGQSELGHSSHVIKTSTQPT